MPPQKCPDMGQIPEIENTRELTIWLEGQFKLVYQAQNVADDELGKLRKTVHDLSNTVQVTMGRLSSLNFDDLKTLVAKHDTELENFTKDAAERKGAIAALKASWGVGGIILGASPSLIYLFTKLVH